MHLTDRPGLAGLTGLAGLVLLAAAAVVVFAALRGWRQGGRAVVHVAGTGAGLVAGVLAAGALSASLSPVTHVLLGVACVLGGLLLGVAAGRLLATSLPLRPGPLGRIAGAVARGGAAALVCWFVIGFVPGLGHDGLVQRVRDSVPAELAGLVPADGSPPTAAEVNALRRQVAGRIVLVHAEGCHSVVGTGFVAASGLVVTNAHVVRGATHLSLADSGGTQHSAAPLVVDARADLAVLRVTDLDVRPLTLATTPARNGASAVLVGHPGGGPLTATPAVVLQRLPLPDPGWRSGLAGLHEAYRLQAVVRHGNSGSPLLDTSGAVIGVVNASSTLDADHGFAISVDELRPDLVLAAHSRGASTGACTT